MKKNMYKLLTAVCLSSVFIFESSFASSEIAVNPKFQIAQVISQWRFFCDKNKYSYNPYQLDLESELKEYTVVSLEKGISRLKIVNPKLAEIVLQRLSKSITVSCGSSLPGGVMGEANPFWGTLLINDAGLNAFLALKSIGKVDGDGMIFHELLHLAKIDNFSPKLHSSYGTDKSADIVYSCGMLPDDEGSAIDSLNSCVVCRLARVEGSKSGIIRDQQALSDAEQFCRSYFEGKPVQNDKMTVSLETIDPSNYLNQNTSNSGGGTRYQFSFDVKSFFRSGAGYAADKKLKCEADLKSTGAVMNNLEKTFASGSLDKSEYRVLRGMLDSQLKRLQACD